MNNSQTNDSDSDFMRDFQEAAFDRREVEREEWDHMEQQDAEARLMDESELSHDRQDCLFCRARGYGDNLSRWLVHMTDGLEEDFDDTSVSYVAASASMQEGVNRKENGLYSMLGYLIVPYIVAEEARLHGGTRAQCTAAVGRYSEPEVLAGLFCSAIPSGLVRFSEGEDPTDRFTGTEALCALLGYVVHKSGLPALRRFVSNIGLYPLP